MGHHKTTLDLPNIARCLARGATRRPAPAPISTTQPTTGPESALQADCERILRTMRVEYLHISHRAREKKGWPDLTFAIAGTPCAVELKTEDGEVSPDQATVLARLEQNGWAVAVVRSVTDFRAFINAHA